MSFCVYCSFIVAQLCYGQVIHYYEMRKFYIFAKQLFRWNPFCEKTLLWKYRFHFEISLDVTSMHWKIIGNKIREDTDPKHLM